MLRSREETLRASLRCLFLFLRFLNFEKLSDASERRLLEISFSCIGFWKPIFEQTDFKEYLKKRYQIGHATIVDEIIEELDAESID